MSPRAIKKGQTVMFSALKRSNPFIIAQVVVKHSHMTHVIIKAFHVQFTKILLSQNQYMGFVIILILPYQIKIITTKINSSI